MPQEILDKHYHSHDVHIRNALKGSGIEIKVPDDVLSSLIHILAYSLIHKEELRQAVRFGAGRLIPSAGEYVLTGKVPGGWSPVYEKKEGMPAERGICFFHHWLAFANVQRYLFQFI